MAPPPIPVVPLEILYPNGRTEAVQIFIWDDVTQQPVLWDGSVSFSGSVPSTVSGNKSNNAAAPTSDNLGALTAIANASAPSWTEGRQVLLSTDLSGALRVAATISTAGLATSARQDTGNTSLASIDTKTPSLGQALAAASVPVVLTAAQLSTLTPPAAITNFALETGGNLATLAGIVSSARAAVNLISGQAGVTGGSGIVGAAVQRVVLATDVALPTGANVIGHVIADSGSTTAVTQATAANLNMTEASAASILATLGATSGAKVITDANGTLQQYLRGLVYLAITQGAQYVVNNQATDFLYNGATALTPKWSTITASTSGANTQVSAVSSKKIRVVALALTANGTVNVKFQSHVTPTDKTGLFYEVANTGFVLPYNPLGWFETIAGEALDINLSASIAVGGVLQYVEV